MEETFWGIVIAVWILSAVKRKDPAFFVIVVLPLSALFFLEGLGKKFNITVWQVLFFIILTVVSLLLLRFAVLTRKERLIRENKRLYTQNVYLQQEEGRKNTEENEYKNTSIEEIIKTIEENRNKIIEGKIIRASEEYKKMVVEETKKKAIEEEKKKAIEEYKKAIAEDKQEQLFRYD